MQTKNRWMKILAVMLSAMLLFGMFAGCGSGYVKGDVTVMSFNTLAAEFCSSPAADRIDGNYAQIKEYMPDVVGMQELCAATYQAYEAIIAEENSPYQFLDLKFTKFSGLRTVNFSNILYNSDTVEVLDCGLVPYETRDNDTCRVITWAKFKMKATGDEFLMTNTHWTLTEGFRVKNAEQLAELAKNLMTEHGTTNFYATGDFNATSDAESFSTFLKLSEFHEASVTAEKKGLLTKTYRIWTGTGPVDEYVKQKTDLAQFAEAIDHICYNDNGMKVNYFTVISNKEVWNSSDHFPILATFDFPE